MRPELPALIALAAACGDNGGRGGADAARADAFVAADARACAANAPAVQRVRVFEADLALAFDGNGAPCEQAIAALPQLATQAPGLDQMLASTEARSCAVAGDTVTVLLRRPSTLDGQTLVAPNFDAVRVRTPLAGGATSAEGTYLSIGELPPPACLDELGLRARLPGRPLYFTVLADRCFDGFGESVYWIQAGDSYVFHDDEHLWIHPDSLTLHRVRSVEIDVLPSHVTEAVWYSDLNCCGAAIGVGCVGTRALVDLFTADVLDRTPRCAPACDP